ncbi:MAG: glycosyltransferase [Paludibacteraceae bacterium]|nr:glycosyltransferase [Paludibacteraceae bacterium]
MQITRIIPQRGINDQGRGKKFALHQLISAATTEYVWLTDDDVIVPTMAPETDADLLILPLRMTGGDSLLERLQIAEYAAIQEVTMSTALRGKAVLCSGANMIVRRERWLESYQDLHPEIPSGDDMFLLESFRRRGLRIACKDAPAYTATVTALTDWRALLRQRMRWAGKAPHYRDPLIRQYGAIILAANMLQLLFLPIILIKFPIEYALIKKRDSSVSLWIALLLELIYPWYMLVCLIGGLFRHSW